MSHRLDRTRHALAGRIGAIRPKAGDPGPILESLRKQADQGRPVLCNLGCGSRLHPDWINIDVNGDGSSVHPWDLHCGLPFPDAVCDAIYSSHLIEHFDRPGAARFLDECRRCLRNGGVLRLVAPDLEDIARNYLGCLEAARRGEPEAAQRYDWMVIELLDQLVRHRSGGEMLSLWRREQVPAEEFVARRIGVEYRLTRRYSAGQPPDRFDTADPMAVGRFRLAGEVHQWMYDRYSLGRILAQHGFVRIEARGAAESSIEGFAAYGLDTESDGTVSKPDSFFIEG